MGVSVRGPGVFIHPQGGIFGEKEKERFKLLLRKDTKISKGKMDEKIIVLHVFPIFAKYDSYTWLVLKGFEGQFSVWPFCQIFSLVQFSNGLTINTKQAPRRNSYTYSDNSEAKLRQQQKLSKRFDKELTRDIRFDSTECDQLGCSKSFSPIQQFDNLTFESTIFSDTKIALRSFLFTKI